MLGDDDGDADVDADDDEDDDGDGQKMTKIQSSSSKLQSLVFVNFFVVHFSLEFSALNLQWLLSGVQVWTKVCTYMHVFSAEEIAAL